jgi:23S rRNA (uracil1939-C5)-methyltransferase
LTVSLIPEQRLELSIEKPAAGGRMIARHDRQVVLVQGAIPGERVVARIERVDRQLAFADTVQVIERSPDRHATGIDPLCGGCLYAHIAYPRQLELKSQIIQDAFARLGRIPLASPVSVAASPERAYRMRARLHARDGRIGFYREGTHELCDAAATGQLSDAAVSSAERAVASLVASGCSVSAVEMTENIAADERVVHVTVAPGSTITDAILDTALAAGGLTGCTARTTDGTMRTSGVPVVTDPLSLLTAGRARGGVLQRHAESFFQANRFLLPQLVTTVLDGVGADGDVLDLYAGVGLFAVSLSVCGVENVTAVEADHSSGADLQRNAAMNGAMVRVAIASVEEFLRRRKGPAARAIVADPPRTGISKEAMQAVVRHQAARILYVSCDPPTMARDARRLMDGGYRLTSLAGLDLFPNTPHVETLGVFDKVV